MGIICEGVELMGREYKGRLDMKPLSQAVTGREAVREKVPERVGLQRGAAVTMRVVLYRFHAF
jgi:hypothetical protein